MILRSELGKIRRLIVCSAHTRRRALRLEKPVVSFCFDDFPRSAYSAGGSILKEFGVRGTYYAALGLMNSCNELGEQFRLEDLDSLLCDGHEIGCHTYSHCSSRRVPLEEFERDAIRGREGIRKVTSRDAGTFAYPFGHATVESKKRLGPQMDSCRGIYSGINFPSADLNLLRANSLYGDVDSGAVSESLLRENQSKQGWLLFYTHDVRRNPSPFGCTPARLERAVSLALELGCMIVPVGTLVSSASFDANA